MENAYYKNLCKKFKFLHQNICFTEAAETQRDRDKYCSRLNHIPLHRTTPPPHMPTTASLGQGRSQGLGAHSRSPVWVAGTEPPEPSLTPSRMGISRKLESEAKIMNGIHLPWYGTGVSSPPACWALGQIPKVIHSPPTCLEPPGVCRYSLVICSSNRM